MTREPSLSYDDVSRSSFATSADADAINEEFRTRLGFASKNLAARLFLARSLSVATEPEPCADSAGRSMKGQQLFGSPDELRTWVALIVEHAELDAASLTQLQDLVRRHWARGAKLLELEWQACEGNYDKFVLRISAQAGVREEGQPGSRAPVRGRGAAGALFVPRAVPVRVPIGPTSTNAKTNEPVAFALNARGGSPHIAVMGTLGTGKTTVAKSIVRAAHDQCGVPVLFFDMGKGDLAADRDLAQSLGATVLECPRSPVPLDVMYLAGSDEVEITTAALRFRESFARVPQSTKLGDIQRNLVGEAALAALKGPRPVRLPVIRDRLRELYATKKRKDDAASTTFDDLTRYKLFEPELSPAEFFSRSWIIDVHTLPEFAQRVVVFLILDAAYAWLSQAQDTPVDGEGNRALRLFLAIDEARKVLEYDQDSFTGLVRESRSKGGVVMTISQSPDDFSSCEDNFFENIGLGVCLRTNARSRDVDRMLGQSADLAGLPTGMALTRLPELGFLQLQAMAPDPTRAKS